MDLASETLAIIEFGHFRIVPHRRELLADGLPVKLGGRAFDMLMALIEGRGTVLGKDALMARVWPNRVIEEKNLHAQISALRAALGTEREVIRTVPGRGYQFTGEIRILSANPDERTGESAATAEPKAVPPTNLPQPVSELVGRDGELREILSLAAAHRLVTLTGAGGIGKTRLALAVARRLLPNFADGVRVAELAPLADPGLVAGTIAAAVGLELAGTISPERVANALGDKELLLVLDNCEHVIDAAAGMAEALLRAGSAVRILATSREPLRAEGERIYPVPPLAVPAAEGDDPWQYGAVWLFVLRSRASGAHISEDRQVALAIAAICRRLDGIPLAIELAAACVAALGIEALAARLDDRFRLLTGGRRTALPRHQTLRATLDWSYELLAESERVVLRRLAVFAGVFSLEAAGAVVASPELAPSEVVDGLANLVAKSLVAAVVDSRITHYRLLDTTRAYALEKLTENGELRSIRPRHAEYYRDLLTRAAQDKSTADDPQLDYAPVIDNIRTALAWAFGPEGDASIGMPLAAVSARVWLEMSLLSECSGWTGKALASLDAADRGTRHEMLLQAALGFSLMATKGLTSEAHAALIRAVELAESLDDLDYQLRTLFCLCLFRLRNADFRSALGLARQCEAVADRITDPRARPTADLMIGLSLFCLGDLAGGRTHLERVRDGPRPTSRRAEIVRIGFDKRVYAVAMLGIIQWLKGFPDQAIEANRTSIDEAQMLEHPVSLAVAIWSRSMVLLWVGDLTTAEQSTANLVEHSKKHSLYNFNAYGLGFEGELFAARGNPGVGVRRLRACLEGMREARHRLYYSVFLGGLAKQVAVAGNVGESLAVISEALKHAEQNDESWYMPELLRIKGDLLLLRSEPSATDAEDCFLRSLDWARRQGALSWELRAATSFARLLRDQNRSAEAIALLTPVYDRFTEGFETDDLKAAKSLIDGFYNSKKHKAAALVELSSRDGAASTGMKAA
jgi:predicted ATPase/DNA-binding winged helix-turn-helix (wHTH) protein